MFKKTNKESQLDFFASVPSMLESSTFMQYSDQGYWHNQFREQVLMCIDETIFKKLFSKKMGVPNASIRIMVGMMILKEGHGWSEIQLFENGRFNLLTRSALGLLNVNDPLHAESTYYLLRKRIYDHLKATGEDLLDFTFEHITHEQIDTILKEESTKTVYRSTKEEITSRLQTLGSLIYKVLQLLPATDCERSQVFQRVFQEQYKVEQN